MPSKKPFVIRWFGPSDLPAIRMIERLSFQSPINKDAFDADNQWQCHVADTADFGVVGFALWDTKAANIRIMRMAVHPEFRRSGFGEAMINCLKRSAVQRNLGINIAIDGRQLAGALFLKAMGFVGKMYGEDEYMFKLHREMVKNT